MFSVVIVQGMVAGKVKQDNIDAIKIKNYFSINKLVSKVFQFLRQQMALTGNSKINNYCL